VSGLAFRGVRTVGVLLALVLAFQFVQPTKTFAAAVIGVSPASGPVGTLVTVGGSGYLPGETVGVAFAPYGLVASGMVNASTQFFASFNIPGGASLGAHTITATGATSHRTATTTFTVTGASPGTLSAQKAVSVNGGGYVTNATATPGSTLSYNIQFSNMTGATTTATTITDTLQPGQSFVSASAGCSASVSGGVTTVTCNLGSVPNYPTAGSIGTVNIVTQVIGGFNGTIPNTAYISATAYSPQPSNTTYVTVGGGGGLADLSKRVSVNGSAYGTTATANPGDELTYDITYSNNTGVNQNVTVYDTLQAGQSLLSYPATSASCTSYNSATRQVTCPLGTVGPGGVVHVFIATTINNTTFPTINNQASATTNGATIYSNTTSVQVFGVSGPPPPGGFPGTGQFQVCGVVTSYTGGSITINNLYIPIAFGAIINGVVQPGVNQCILFTFNSAGQATSLVVTSNLPAVNVVCGIFTTTVAFSSITVSGFTMPVVSGATFFSFLQTGAFYCFLVNVSGQCFAVLNNIPTSATVSSPHAASFRSGRATGF
jgi:uncharacterized repeat protein (TIGR01451 family)